MSSRLAGRLSWLANKPMQPSWNLAPPTRNQNRLYDKYRSVQLIPHNIMPSHSHKCVTARIRAQLRIISLPTQRLGLMPYKENRVPQKIMQTCRRCLNCVRQFESLISERDIRIEFNCYHCCCYKWRYHWQRGPAVCSVYNRITWYL